MFRKLTAGLLALCLTAAALPIVHAESTAEEMNRLITSQYADVLAVNEMESMHGMCGLLVSWQLYYQGINCGRFSADGKDYYDIYKDMTRTSGGYPVHCYGSEDYTLRQALNTATHNGTRDVRNLLVGFQWTETQAGQKSGHVVFVYGILDGICYFTESSVTSFGTQEGEMVKCTIDQFADYYADWMVFDGLVVFGEKDAVGRCTYYPSSCYVKTVSPAPVLQEPGMQENGHRWRQARPGECLEVTGLYQNPEGEYYYEVREQGQFLYVPADCTRFLMANPETVTYEPGKERFAEGRVSAEYGAMAGLYLDVRDASGNQVYSRALHEVSSLYNLGSERMQQMVEEYPHLPELEDRVSVELRNYYVDQGRLTVDQTMIHLQEGTQENLTAGKDNGFVRKDGKWYFYWDHKPRTGWVIYEGIHYYMDSHGAALTGVQQMDGTEYHFSDTGALISPITE